MNTYLDCIPCFFRQALAAAREATPELGVQRTVLNAVAHSIPDLPLEATPPELAQVVFRVVREITGNDDPYRKLKKRSNEDVLENYLYLKDIVANSEDPLQTSCKLAIAGNAIDLGPRRSV